MKQTNNNSQKGNTNVQKELSPPFVFEEQKDKTKGQDEEEVNYYKRLFCE
jgi:hypothetical protein